MCTLYLANVLTHKECLTCAGMAYLHVFLHVNIRGDNWLEPCRAKGIVMTLRQDHTHTRTLVSLAQVSHGMAHAFWF